MTSARGRSAWLITWEWAGEHAAVDQPIAAILPVQSSPETVKLLMERLYASSSYTPEEMLAALPPRGHNPYRATYGSIRVYDHGVPVTAPLQRSARLRSQPVPLRSPGLGTPCRQWHLRRRITAS